ncbi:uncharacterized protein PpBr36_09750 [Pyricularia pennisetigena]|uniref:uncharacterized protein n=1 Tax=Pyricularia pennisetigena TaxID=1578925 RepID=UPI001151558F|nr:uncharacterized protein PpBr36_09750 [Pyricularia pennisetigena]TLS22271.1 hypothetical protein PpBr36_09750 [Pyricularia pennisetigena]
MSRREAEAKVKAWGFPHVFTWTDGPNAHYTPHTHNGLTTHLILDGELTITYPEDDNPTKETFGVGSRIDVDAGRVHEVWIGKDGCTYVIGEISQIAYPTRGLQLPCRKASKIASDQTSARYNMPTFGRHQDAGGALRKLVNMTTLMVPTQGGFHKPKATDHIDSAIDSNMTICPGFESHIVRIFKNLCGPGEATVSRERFQAFLEDVQGDVVTKPLEKETYNLYQFFETWSYVYRMKPQTKIDPAEKDLSKPISHYFISSSHNTYLLGNQLTSVSSVEAYQTALEQDCRCIEIDVWNSPEYASGLRTPSRSKSPRPGHKRHLSASSISSAFEERLESLKQVFTGKSYSSSQTTTNRTRTLKVPPCDRRNSNNLEVPLTRNSDTTFTTGSNTAVDDPEDNDVPEIHTRTRSRSLANPSMEPVVMHAHTYAQRDWTLGNYVGFRDVCRTIRKTAFVKNHLPIIISLEVHADVQQQDLMVEIMQQEWGDHLLQEQIFGCDPRLRLPTLEELKDKILIKVKKASVVANSNGTADSLGIPLTALIRGSAPGSSSDEEAGANSNRPKISTRLSNLAVYTHSKHFAGFGTRVAKSPSHIFSLSEGNIKRWAKEDPEGMKSHNKSFLMRAYPDPVSRVDSGNMDPVFCWRRGVQMVAMNWQTLDGEMMINHAMFADQAGWALKPAAMRGLPDDSFGPKTVELLRITAFAGQNIRPVVGETVSSFDPSISISLCVEGQDPIKHHLPSRETSNPDWGHEGKSVCFKDVANVMERFSFVKIKVEDDGELSSWACYRLDRLRQGYRFVELMGPRGERTEGKLLVKIDKVIR